MADASVVACATSTSADDGAVLVLDAPPPDLTPSSRRGKKHLPKEAYDILKDYFFNVNRFPKKHERLELAAKVNSVPGCEAYTPKGVEGYFANLRKRFHQASDVVVKRELVEEPLSLSVDRAATNGATIGDNAASISTAPRKKRKSQVKDPGGSLATTSATTVKHALSTASTVASISTTLASTSASTAPSAKTNRKKWTRLKAEGYKVLSDFFNDVSRYPTAAQKAELLAVVTSMKGCEGYTLQKLTAYFSRMRIERKQPVAFVKAESPDSLSNAAFFPDQGPSQKPFLAVPPVEPEPLPAQPFMVLRPEPVAPEPYLVLRPEPAPPKPLLVPSKPFLVLRPATEPEPVPEAEPLLATTRSSPILHITRSALRPPESTSLASSESHFNVFSIFEPVGHTPSAPPQLHIGPQTTVSDSAAATVHGTVEHGPLRHPPDTPIVHPSSPVDSGAVPTDVPTTPHAVEAVETNNTVCGPSDPIPAPTPSPKHTPRKNPESKPPKRTLTNAALKMLDDYYATVTPNPSTTQCATLATQVSALPDDGRCTAKQVRKYFKKRRVEERCEALKTDRMGVGAEADEPALVLVAVAVVEPKSDGFGHETEMASNADPAASISEMSEAATASSPPTQGGGDDRGGDLAVQDVPMDDVPEGGEPEDLVQRSPRLDHDGEAPGGHMQERTDAGTEADIEHPELDSEIVAEVEPNSISKLDNSLCEVPMPDAVATDLSAVSASSPPVPSEEDKGRADEVVPDVSMSDVPENHQSDPADPASLGSNHGGECRDDHIQIPGEKERGDAQTEADVEHAEPDIELAAETEPNSTSMPDEAMCEVMADALPADPVDLLDLSSPAPSGMHGDDSDDQPIPDIPMATLSEVSEGVLPDDVIPDDVMPEDVVPEGVALDTLQLKGGTVTPIEIDSDAPHTSIQAEMFGLAMQLQRIFSKPPVIDEGHPTTFADFATWLQTRNAGPLCIEDL